MKTVDKAPTTAMIKDTMAINWPTLKTSFLVV